MAKSFQDQCKKFLDNVFLKHPREVNESYSQHLFFASKTGFQLLLAGMACITHAIFPIFFKHTASNIVERVYDRMHNRKK